ncbi:XdhC family protein [Chitinophaga vietnamensis]|uniref:XdhC family protein n=1 Tax=Chitinophaga vietnamensis TaxID=2593957 RepID=UPI001178A4CC|nr:XdhC/CoxI family protein [Chitinophaga vietnamensis]
MTKELQDIVQAFEQATRAGLKTALATVVHVEGSAYRQPGARMLITENGTLTGAISGGCLEGDALRRAQMVIMQQQPMLLTYDTRDEEEDQLGVGLGCNGIIHILLEPVISADPQHPLLLLQQAVLQREAAVIVTLFSLQQRKGPQPGTRLLLKPNMEFNNLDKDPLQSAILADAAHSLTQRQSVIKTYATGQRQLSVLIQYLPPVMQLLIAGAGNDAIPVEKIARLLGWRTIVADGRPAYASRIRFPEASQLIVAKAAAVLDQLQPDAHTAVILMTHNYQYDLTLLQQLIPLALPYTGILGPAKKLQRMLDELAPVTAVQRSRLHGPAGLDIGAESAEEIALSIISEIKAVMAAASSAPLRNRAGAIHNRASQVIIHQQL